MSDGLRRSFLLGRDAGTAICQERRQTMSLLVDHWRMGAGYALMEGEFSARRDFEMMRSAMYAGGFHCVRLTGGRSIDRR